MSYKKEVYFNKLIKKLQDSNADYEQIIKARNETMIYSKLDINEDNLLMQICRLIDISDGFDYYLMQRFEDTFNIKERFTLSKADENKAYNIEMPTEIIYKYKDEEIRR